MRKRLYAATLVRIGVFIAAFPLDASTLSWTLIPPTLHVQAGELVNVSVMINGKPVGRPPSIGAFDFDVSFDPVFLSPTGVQFGSFLGNPRTGEALISFAFSPGVVDFAEVSLLAPAQLDALQPPVFALASLSFNALATGATSLSFSEAIVDDAFGNKIPEPGTVLLLASALAALLGARRAAHKPSESRDTVRRTCAATSDRFLISTRPLQRRRSALPRCNSSGR